MSPVATAPAALTANDAELRVRYLDELLALLYPEPCAAQRAGRRRDRGGALAEYLVVPDARRPRLLAPARRPGIAAAAVRRYAEPQSRLARLKRGAVVAALRTGASTVLLRDRIRIHGPEGAGIDGYLRDALGDDLALSIHIGPSRANRKPVLQLITADGDTVGFAKLGTGPLTRRLVQAETAALDRLAAAPLHALTVPRVLHAGRWRGLTVLVQSALPVWRRRAKLTPDRLVAAMRELAEAYGVTGGPLAATPYGQGLRERVTAVADRPEGAELAAAARTLGDRIGDLELRYGAWHGDWAPWNMAALADTLLVWDWERFAVGVPLGFDALHHELQRRVQAGPDAAAAVERTLRRAPELLAPFGVPAAHAEPTALLYLIELAARYLADRQAEAGARLGVLGTWLLPVLVRRVAGHEGSHR